MTIIYTQIDNFFWHQIKIYAKVEPLGLHDSFSYFVQIYVLSLATFICMQFLYFHNHSTMTANIKNTKKKQKM